jgi:FtsH-binding integral membrane protein
MAATMTLTMTLALTLYACTTKTDFTECGDFLFVFGMGLFIFALFLFFVTTFKLIKSSNANYFTLFIAV